MCGDSLPIDFFNTQRVFYNLMCHLFNVILKLIFVSGHKDQIMIAGYVEGGTLKFKVSCGTQVILFTDPRNRVDTGFHQVREPCLTNLCSFNILHCSATNDFLLLNWDGILIQYSLDLGLLDLGVLDLGHSLDLEHKSWAKELDRYIKHYLNLGHLFSSPFCQKLALFFRKTLSFFAIFARN